MSTTVSQLIEQISSNLHNFTGTIEPQTHLISAIDADDDTVAVQDPIRLTRGIIEIDDELLFLANANEGGLATVEKFGRGFSNSTAAAHDNFARVINDPLFPRVRIFDAIKQAVQQIQPDLFAVTTTTFTASPVQTTYEIPAETDRVLKVQYQVIGPSEEWLTIPNWSVDMNAAGATGKAIVLYTAVPAGRTIQVTYAKPFTAPTTTADTLEVTCDIPASVHDVIIYNACWRLVQFMPLPRFDLRAVEQQARAQSADPNAVMKFAQQMYATYELRKAEERKRLLQTYPTPKRFAVR